MNINANITGGSERKPVLVLENTEHQNMVIPITQEKTYIGRSGDNHIMLDDVTVGKNHCTLVKIQGNIYIQDGGSMNGTYLNKEILPHYIESPNNKGTMLVNKDILQIGKFVFRYLNK